VRRAVQGQFKCRDARDGNACDDEYDAGVLTDQLCAVHHSMHARFRGPRSHRPIVTHHAAQTRASCPVLFPMPLAQTTWWDCTGSLARPIKDTPPPVFQSACQ
jgi:hypothetical protein